MLTHVDLFSGIGGFALAARWAGVETIAFSEIDSYASRVLEKRFPGVRNYGDVRNVPSLSAWLLTGGVPCQPASIAGKRQGAADDRWLWPEALAVVENGNYEWVLFENPTGILSLNDGVEFERICAALEGQGYEVQPLVIPACGVGALHRRNRIWILAHAVNPRPSRTGGGHEPQESQRLAFNAGSEDVAHSISEQLRTGRHGEVVGAASASESGEEERERVWDDVGERGESGDASDDDERKWWPYTGDEWRRGSVIGNWMLEPNVGRVANGIPARVDRLRCLGNAIVPQVAYQLFRRMKET